MRPVEWLPTLLVALGVVLLVAAGAVWHRGQKTRACLRALLDLPSDMHPMLWPEQAKHALQMAGIMGLRWEGHWFGDPVAGQWGVSISPKWPGKVLDAGSECRIQVAWAALARTNEAHSLALAVLDVFAQVWLARMRAHTQTVAVALAQRAELHLYWQHDMRNLAQWVGMLAEEFEDATPEQLPRLAQRLQQQAPLVLQRAQRLLTATHTASLRASSSASDILPHSNAHCALRVVQDAAVLAGIHLQLDPTPLPQDKSVPIHHTTAQALERSLDNVLSNIARDSNTRLTPSPLVGHWSVQDAFWRLVLQTPLLNTPWPMRPFEPLQASAKGAGLGLYQARRSVRDIGGDLQATHTATGVLFTWHVPLLGQGATSQATQNTTADADKRQLF